MWSEGVVEVRYGTIKRGKVKFELGGKQHKYLEWKKLPYSVVVIKSGIKHITRMNV